MNNELILRDTKMDLFIQFIIHLFVDLLILSMIYE